MLLELLVIVVMEPFDGGILNSPVHPLDLTVGPWVLHFCQAVFNAVSSADPVKDVLELMEIARPIGELDAIVGQNSMDGIGHSGDQIAQELCSIHLSCLGIEFNEGILGSPVNSHKEIELAFSCLYLGNIDMEIADRIALETLLWLLVAFDTR